MSPAETWFVSAVVATAAALVASTALLRRPLDRVLLDLLGSERRARFYALAFFGLLTTSALAGSLWPADASLELSASAVAAQVRAARQLLAAGIALLLGLSGAGLQLLLLILAYEARRGESMHTTPRTRPPMP